MKVATCPLAARFRLEAVAHENGSHFLISIIRSERGGNRWETKWVRQQPRRWGSAEGEQEGNRHT